MTTTPNTTEQIHRRAFEGTVVSKTGAKTVKVRVERTAFHRKYRKHYTRNTQFLVHDEKDQFKVGDQVRFVECRPLSHSKRWRVLYSTAA